MKTDDKKTDDKLTNHEITVCLQGGAVLGPFKATWSKTMPSDVRQLTRDYDAFLQGSPQVRFKYHLHDPHAHVAHTLFVSFANVTGIYDHVDLRDHD